jgi:hypothetical protein
MIWDEIEGDFALFRVKRVFRGGSIPAGCAGRGGGGRGGSGEAELDSQLHPSGQGHALTPGGLPRLGDDLGIEGEQVIRPLAVLGGHGGSICTPAPQVNHDSMTYTTTHGGVWYDRQSVACRTIMAWYFSG